MSNPYNQLTNGQTERLVVLMEECGEVIQAASKVLRHGYENHHPDFLHSTNKKELAKEINDVRLSVNRLCSFQDLDINYLMALENDKEREKTKTSYMYYDGEL